MLYDGNYASMNLVDLSLGILVSCIQMSRMGVLLTVASKWTSWRLVLRWPQFHVVHVIGYEYVWVCMFVSVSGLVRCLWGCWVL